MTRRMRVCGRHDLQDGECRGVLVDGRVIALARDRGRFFALDNTCPHRGGPLSEGDVEAGKLHCPLHGWAFDLVTGEMPGSASVSVPVYEVSIDGDDVLVSLEPHALEEGG